MKIKAYQVAPECQESPLSLFDEWAEGLEIYGNRDYVRRTSATFDEVLECLENGDFSDFEFTGYKAERLEELCNKYGLRGFCLYALPVCLAQRAFCHALHFITVI